MKILAVDLGLVRTGVAVCDINEILASPLCVITERNQAKLAEKIAEIALSQGVGEVVLGYPKNMNGTTGDSAKRSTEFAACLQEILAVPVILWDERGTTVSAHNYLSTNDVNAKKRKKIVDSVAATIILQSYLSFRANKKLTSHNFSDNK